MSCAVGAIGGAASAISAPLIRDGLYAGSQTVIDNGDGTELENVEVKSLIFLPVSNGLIYCYGSNLSAFLMLFFYGSK